MNSQRSQIVIACDISLSTNNNKLTFPRGRHIYYIVTNEEDDVSHPLVTPSMTRTKNYRSGFNTRQFLFVWYSVVISSGFLLACALQCRLHSADSTIVPPAMIWVRIWKARRCYLQTSEPSHWPSGRKTCLSTNYVAKITLTWRQRKLATFMI